MMDKTYTDVVIAGKTYTLGGYEDGSYLQQIAAYINARNGELRELPGFTRQSAEYQNVMLLLNLTDDYFKARKKAATLEAKLEELEKEVYSLRHELVARQIKYEQTSEQD